MTKNFFYFRDLLAVLHATDVDGAAAGVHDAHVVLVVGHDQDVPGEEVPRVKAACGVHPQEALVVDGGDVEPDLVHVAEEHDLQRAAVLALFAGLALGLALGHHAGDAAADEVAQRISLHGIKQPLPLPSLLGCACALFSPGDAGGFAEGFQECGVFHGWFLESCVDDVDVVGGRKAPHLPNPTPRGREGSRWYRRPADGRGKGFLPATRRSHVVRIALSRRYRRRSTMSLAETRTSTPGSRSTLRSVPVP